MTATRDPDRLLRAWLDLMPDEAPDRAIAGVLKATEHTPQRRPSLGQVAWRPSPVNRFAYAAAAVAIVATLATGALMFRPSFDSGAPPTASPTASSAPGVSFAPTTAAIELRATWLATGTPARDTEAVIPRLVVSPSGDMVSVVDGGVTMFASVPIAGTFNELTIRTIDPLGGCQLGDVGRYRWAFGTDGAVPDSDFTLLGLTAVDDQCGARRARLEGTWVHAVDADSRGGRGVIAAFRPMFEITLPRAAYTGTIGPGWASVVSTEIDRTLVTVRPGRWSEPCATIGGVVDPGDRTIETFTAHLRTLPGLTVESTPTVVDGRVASLLTLSSVETADCPSRRVILFSWERLGENKTWFLTQGETTIVCLVVFEYGLVALQWSGEGVTPEEVQALMDTVNFTDTLPPGEY